MSTNWRKLEAVLQAAFTGNPDIQEAAARAVRYLEERSLNNPARMEDAARVAMGLGDMAA